MQHNARVRRRAVEALLKLRNIGFISETSGGWPGGVELDPQRYNPTTEIAIANTNQSARLRVISFYPDSQLAMS